MFIDKLTLWCLGLILGMEIQRYLIKPSYTHWESFFSWLTVGLALFGSLITFSNPLW